MILQALHGYYERLLDENRVVPQGFQKKEIPFVIVLDAEGKFVDLEDTRSGEGRNRRTGRFVVPQSVERTGDNAWQKANLLWDHKGYVVGHSDTDHATAKKQHESFLGRIREVLKGLPDEGVKAVTRFLEIGDFQGILAHPTWRDVVAKGGSLSFRLSDETLLVCERPAVRQRVAAVATSVESGTPPQACLITGESAVPARTHSPIKGVRRKNKTTTRAKIVSFKLPAFGSYGKQQSLNAPMGRRAEFSYTTALNTLLDRDSHQKLIVGDSTVIFWTERRHEIESVFANFFGEQEKGVPVQDHKQILALYRAPESGVRPELDPTIRFYILGLVAPNEARIAVRFWYTGPVREVAENIGAHFDDLEIAAPPKWSPYLSIRTLLRAIATRNDLDTVPPNLAGDTMKAILVGTSYPSPLLAAAIRRIRAEQSQKDPRTGTLTPNVTYARVALIKAILVRDTRIGGPFRLNAGKEVGMSLDIGNTNVGYRLGRLFAILEKTQEEASPGINATIRDRFYGAASATPIAAFPHLMKLKNHHLTKIENRGRAINIEKLIGEIMDGITDFPVHLSLQDQGRFAVGYYHQRQRLFGN
ncbi:type I-C CRISPR-associated protein Cas8c/Csd1 [Candidatus Methylomirabilis sp.]|uniref:type I-C CRISPR-associated protein Cas8c/Csd1 n=1 Tax=Candidatus Methylomirabilis sp. TaxID=2032687 RepID=UPI002A60C0A6|nr:type I-C CRISPR-associated protein Cas8c/Csd1 [Candidatus Methylomirabilis sp.]